MVKYNSRFNDGNGNGLYTLGVMERKLRNAGQPEEAIQKVVVANLITLEEASEKSGAPYGTLGRWLHFGHLQERGRRKFAAPGGGKVLVDEDEVAYLVENPPKPGRPRKIPEEPT